MKLVFCSKLHEELEGLITAPFPGELGERILKEISKKAWQQWLTHQTLLINEHRLNLLDPSARQYLKVEMEKFFFGQGSEKPKGFHEV